MSKNRIPLARLTESLFRGEWTESPPDMVTSVKIDSRKCKPGDLFVALQGTDSHGHQYVAGAVNNGARAAFVETRQPVDCPQFVTENSLKSFQELARKYRQQLATGVVGITGSCGKTTVKEILAKLIAAENTVGRTPGNYNNHIGLPLTVLNEGGEEFLVAEIAMNKPGEIKLLSEILSPEVGIITHIGPAHLAGVRTVKQLAQEKAQLLASLPEDGLALVPDWVDKRETLCSASRAPVVMPGLTAEADLPVSWELSEKGTTFRLNDNKYRCNFVREELVKDTILAVVAAQRLGVKDELIREALARFKPLEGRGEEKIIGNTTVIDGSYNANPDSMKAALRRLEALPGPRLAVLGTMKEMGAKAPEAHRELGQWLTQIPELEVHFVGEFGDELADGMEGNQNLRLHEAVVDLNGLDPSLYNSVLVKASNAVGLEKLIKEWTENR